MKERAKLAMNSAPDTEVPIFYSEVVRVLTRANIPVLLGGGFALEFYTHLGRRLKDMDLFILRRDWKRVATVLNQSNFRTELTFSHLLGKVFYADQFIDIIFSSGNGLCEVDSLWFKHSVPGTVFGVPISFCPPEEMIWSKSFVMERERYDGADVAHLLLKRGQHLDWQRLLGRFGKHWRVLFSHLVLFDYIYPSESASVPHEVRVELLERMKRDMSLPPTPLKWARGTMLSRSQYEIDIAKLGYADARVVPEGRLSPKEAAAWTAAAETVNETD